MKKLTTIFALFTLVMLTSFVSPNDVGGRKGTGTDSQGEGFSDVGGRRGTGTDSQGEVFSEVGGRKGTGTDSQGE